MIRFTSLSNCGGRPPVVGNWTAKGGHVSPNSDGPNSGAQVSRIGGREKLEKVVIRFAGDSGDGVRRPVHLRGRAARQ